MQFHPYYHELFDLGITNGVSAYAWNNQSKPGAMVWAFNIIKSSAFSRLKSMILSLSLSLRWQEDV